MLCTLMQPIRVAAGQYIVRQHTPGDALFLIASGQARLETTHSDAAAPVTVGTLQPGQCCGHLAVLSAGEHCASVVAVTDMTVLRLSREAHDTYLAGLPDVDRRLCRHALHQWAALSQAQHQRLSQYAAATCGCGQVCCCGDTTAAEGATPS